MPAKKYETPGPDRKMPEPEPELPPEESHLARIDVRPHHINPYILYCEWRLEARKNGLTAYQADTMALSTVTRQGKPNNRMIAIKKFKNNMFIFTVSDCSRTAQELSENRNVTGVFFFQYHKYKSDIVRQIRVEGKVKKLCSGVTQIYYETEPLNQRIKYEIVNTGEMVDWNDLKKKHDKEVVQVKYCGKHLEMPDNYVGYAIIPTLFEFWHAEEDYIADRVMFAKNCDCGWNVRRLAA